MKNFWGVLIGLMVVSGIAYGININVERRDMKLATQQLLEKQSWTAPEANDSGYIAWSGGDTDGTGLTLTAFTAQPDFARTLSVLPLGTTADVAAGNVTVTGTDIHGSAIEEEFTFTANQATAVQGTKAFASVTQIEFPAEDSPYGAEWHVGIDEKLGVKRCMDSAAHHFLTVLGTTKESTDPSVVADASTISNNTVELDSQLDGSSNVEFYFLQNFRCSP